MKNFILCIHCDIEQTYRKKYRDVAIRIIILQPVLILWAWWYTKVER
jgi:hypothetical protein